ncbi:MAG TPA: hypothetical protein PKY59_13135 [Pyrinomonadaceae bacterium]|nr:hypothetical protein [Pyrinomonadaceae bacterium]
MANEKNNFFNDSEKDTTATGRDLPNGDGTIGDEEIQAITDDGKGKPTGQDHSTEDYEKSMPTSGVGAVQNNSDTTSDIADIKE